MSTDRFISGVQLPNVDSATTVRASDSLIYRRTFYKDGELFSTDETGAEKQLSGRIATDTTLGEVQVDGTTITVDAAGIITAVGGGGGISNVVEDTTPQLGGNLDVNNFDISGTGDITLVNATFDQIQLTGGTGTQGILTWNADEETLDLVENGTTLQLGQEVLYNVKNQTGSTILNGTPVQAVGTLGNSGRILVSPMDGTNPANAKFFIGVTTEDIPDGADGKVTHFGKVRGIDLTAYQEGDVLWVSTTNVGQFTTTEPSIGIKIPTAFVIANTDPGTMMVRAQKSMGLVDLDDVFKETLDSSFEGSSLVWNNANTRFEVTSLNPLNLRDSVGDIVSTLEATGNTNNSQIVFQNYQDAVLSTGLTIDETGAVTASSFAGDGSALTNISYTVTQGDVTQHEAALTITESQISDLQTYLTDAPSDGNQYARESGAWTVVTGGGDTNYLPTKIDGITTVNGQSTYALTVGGQAYTPSLALAMLVSVNGVIQEAGTAYTISGTDIVFTSPMQTGDVIDFIVDLAKAVEVDIPTEMNDLSTVVTWAAVPNEFITESAVTQHETALSITESQISDLQTYLTAEADTLDTVTTRNNTTTNDINVGSITATNSASANTIDVTSYIDFGILQVTPPAHSEGRVYYNEEYNCLTVYNDITDISLQVGQEEWVRVYNGTGSTISNGTPCRPVGVFSESQSVAPANASSLGGARVLGVATHDIPTGTFGYLTVRGLLSGIDTTGLTAGGPVWLGPTGGLQTSAPTYPYYPTQIGGCIVVDATNGYLYISPSYNTQTQLRVAQNGHIDGNLTIDGDLTINGTQTITTQNNLAINDAFIYLNSGDVIGESGTTFTGTGLDDAYFTGYFEGTTATTFYVRIDGVGTGTGGVDTFEWSIDNFSTTEATGVDITGAEQVLQDNIGVFFNATTGHTSGDQWSGTATPLNVDTGWSTNRNTGTSGVGYTHLGVFFDASDEKFKFFDQYAPEPSGAINTGDASYNAGTVVAASFEGALVGNASTATALATGQNIQLTGDVTGTTSAAFDGTGTATIATTLSATYLTDITGENIGDLSDVSATAPTDGQVLTYNNTAGEWEPQDATGGGGGITTGKAIAMAMIFG